MLDKARDRERKRIDRIREQATVPPQLPKLYEWTMRRRKERQEITRLIVEKKQVRSKREGEEGRGKRKRERCVEGGCH